MITTDQYVFFYGNCIYSNWHVSRDQFRDPIIGVTFANSEQGFMFYKARFFGDIDIAHEIAEQPLPYKVKALGRLVKGYDDKAWQCVREGIMTYICWLKFSQN